VQRSTVHNERGLSHYERLAVWAKALTLCRRRPSTGVSVPGIRFAYNSVLGLYGGQHLLPYGLAHTPHGKG
jgi:O-antigen ligase